MNGIWLNWLIFQSGPWLVAPAEAEQIDCIAGRLFRQNRLVKSPVLGVGTESVD